MKMRYIVSFLLAFILLSTVVSAEIQIPLVFRTCSSSSPEDTLYSIQIQTSTDSLFIGDLTQSNWLSCQPNSQFTYYASFADTLLSETYFWRGRHRRISSIPDTSISDWSSTFHFTLNLQPSLIVFLSPDYLSVNRGDIDTLWISLNETVNRLEASYFNIRYDHNYITVNSVIKGPVLSPPDNSFLSYDIHTDSVVMSLAILEGSFTGTGQLLGLIFTSTQAGSTSLSFNTSVLRDSANQNILHSNSGATLQIQIADTTRPTVVVNSPVSGDTINYLPTLSIRLADNSGLNRGYYRLDNCTGIWNELWAYNSASSDTTISWRVPQIAEGTHNIFFRVTDDLGNVNIDTCSYYWSFTYDTIPPSPPTNFVIRPGNRKCRLSWTNPTGSFKGVEIRRNPWANNAYPEYDDSYPSPLGYPANQTSGELVYKGSGTSYQDSNEVASFPRNVYYYSIFAYDRAGNYSKLSAGDTARATNYWLGDVDGDGRVYFSDLSIFAGTYDTKDGDTEYLPEFDIGPTTNSSAEGIPLTDNKIDFEDLVVFAMNYMAVGNLRVMSGSSGKAVSGDLGLSLTKSTDNWILGNEFDVKVSLVNNPDTVKSIHFILPYDSLQLKVIDVKRSYQLIDSAQPVFFYGKDTGYEVDVSLAILGANTSIVGSGEIAVITFEILEQAEPVLAFSLVDLRDNQGLPLEVEEDPGHQTPPEIPQEFRLNQNYPNPFNASTQINYQLTQPGKVSLKIYNIKGELVCDLVDGYYPAGYHRAVWDSRNRDGMIVSSGIYFYQIVSEDFAETKKMMLIK
jgi:hypothetical protein